MKFEFACNYTVATLLIVICLTLPTISFAHAAALEVTLTPSHVACDTTMSAPCDDCPCSDGHGSCCDTTTCTCECNAPISQFLQLTYVPVIASQNFREPCWSLPEVYSHIFVPPQNLA
ncbi:MAG: hypothetical protein Q7W05_07875 [Deltaproteobacteria bacterium]|nr:hypothetical protein [Deltaproteobacteria bacterium]